jgi:hypothetical protein
MRRDDKNKIVSINVTTECLFASRGKNASDVNRRLSEDKEASGRFMTLFCGGINHREKYSAGFGPDMLPPFSMTVNRIHFALTKLDSTDYIHPSQSHIEIGQV